MNRFSGSRVALVTGAAGDIGAAVAVRLASEGASLILADQVGSSTQLEGTLDRCQAGLARDATAVTASFDVTDIAATRSSIAGASSRIGVPDLVFNNAGYQGEFANILDVDVTDAQRVLAVNVIGVLNVLQASARILSEAGRPGAIVNTASMAGVAGAPNMAAYSASKAAVIALTASAAKDLAPLGIRVNAVSPGFIGPGAMWDKQVRRQAEVSSIYYADDEETVVEQMIGQVPLRRYGSVDEVAGVVSFLLSDDASYVTGQNIEISGAAP